jgi:SPX domain protein involved in polyphosphate accumulation
MSLRFERKYLVHNNLLLDLRKRLMPFVYPDKMATNNGVISEYTVRSIYFDSSRYNSYFEKVEGVKIRKKLRIRGYNQYQEGCQVFLEIKRKIGDNIAKNRVLVPFDSLEDLLKTGDIASYIPNNNDPLAYENAGRFFYNYKKYSQKPVNLIVYDREPFQGKFDPGVRLTFDKNVRAALNPQISDLFKEEGLSYVWEKHFILEIKYFTHLMPQWARSLIEEFHLKQAALSKYTNGLDIHQLAFQ